MYEVKLPLYWERYLNLYAVIKTHKYCDFENRFPFTGINKWFKWNKLYIFTANKLLCM